MSTAHQTALIEGLMNEEIWLIEFSEIQGCVHTETLSRTLQRQKRASMCPNPTDYKIVAFAASGDEARHFASKIQNAHLM